MTVAATAERPAAAKAPFRTAMASYYADKVHILRDIFGVEDVQVKHDHLQVGTQRYPVVDDVIDLLVPSPDHAGSQPEKGPFAADVQASFGAEWETFHRIEPEHQAEFAQYFDLIDVEALQDARLVDLGCGMGRWSHFLADRCREIVLIDFSDAIHVARRNLRDKPNALFFKADILNLPFKPRFADFAFSLGVLHHLPIPALDAVRRLADCAPRFLVYLYYALDNRPWYFRSLLRPVDAVRRSASRVRASAFRNGFTATVAAAVYLPLVGLGHVFSLVGAGAKVPLYETYRGKSFRRIRQDVYDRFFTSIEQRVRRYDILALSDVFERVTVSDGLPFWHFLLEGPKLAATRKRE